MRVLVTGGTGFVGRALLAALSKEGHAPIALVRHLKGSETLPCAVRAWPNPYEPFSDGGFPRCDAIIHLAGEPIVPSSGLSRWSDSLKKRIYDSRVLTTRALLESVKKLPLDQRPKALICASAIGFYGDRGSEVLTEGSAPGSGFLSEVTQAWEKAASSGTELGLSVHCLRIGVVLGKNGGALPRMPAIPMGAGSGWVSWIHLDDLVQMILYALDPGRQKEGAVSIFNACAPHPVTSREFARALARARGWGAAIPVGPPSSLMRGILGEMASVVLSSQRVLPKLSEKDGFNFKYSELKKALADIYDGDEIYEAYQVVPKPIEEVFSFFSDAKNLEEITPPWLNFKIVRKSSPEIKAGTEIDYRLKIHGFPAKWRTLIKTWDPPRSFVDTQLKGPYALWHHTHSFWPVEGGTLMMDRVRFRVPLGRLGKAVALDWVRGDIESIFDFRRTKIRTLMK